MDTQEPYVVSVTPEKEILTSADVGAFGIWVVFDQVMNQSVAPNLTFNENPAGKVWIRIMEGILNYCFLTGTD